MDRAADRSAAVEVRAKSLLAEASGDAVALGKLLAKHAEPTRVITVRLPASFHEALLEQVERERTATNKLSLNQLCVRRMMLGNEHDAAAIAAVRQLGEEALAREPAEVA